MRKLYPFLLLIGIFTWVVPASAQMRETGLSFSVQSKVIDTVSPTQAGAPTKNTSVGYKTVTLFPELISIKDKQTETIYDFKNQQLISLSPATRTYFITSLYAVPAFKAMEKANRAMIGGALGKAGITQMGNVEPFDLDMMFGGPFKSEDAKGVSSTKDATGGKYKFRGEDIAGYTVTRTPIPDALKKSYARYIAYEFTLHPLIQKELSERALFATLRFTNHGMIPAVSEKTFGTSLARETTEPPPSIPTGYKLAQPGKEAAISVLLAAPPKVTAQDSLALIKKLHADKKYTDVAVAFMGHTYAYGTDGVEQLKPVLGNLMKEAPPTSGVREIFGICSAQPSAQGAAQKVTFLKQVQAGNPVLGYMIGGCLALYQDAAGKPADAQATRLAALARNPAMVAVMKDLGDGYYRQYDPFMAWAFWNKARAINPGHPILSGLGSLEEKLARDYPDYF